MKIVFHPDYLQQYDFTPAGDSGRLQPALKLLKKIPNYQFITPEPAPLEAIERAHTSSHIKDIQNTREGIHDLYQMARLGAGGAILCAEIAITGEPA
ncbi:MAG: histone deacetylase family protein, partial [Spirochaetes bacterium]|nr:histone deacetylase family protein [Spirochaetota bacterium]